MSWRTAGGYALMWGIRYTPLPWSLKSRVIHLLTPRTLLVGTALIPDAEGRVLMLRARYSGRWLPPGGSLHPHENPLEGVRRECREELGAEVEVCRLVGLYCLARTGELFVAFDCAPLVAPPRLSNEHERYRYVTPEHLPWWVRVMHEDARRDDPAPAIRTI